MNVTRIQSCAANFANASVCQYELSSNVKPFSNQLYSLTSDCLNFNADERAALFEATKPENDPDQEQVIEETYVIDNEIPYSCYTIAPNKKRSNVLTRDIIESTVECVISQAEECQKNNVTSKTAELQIIEEFGRCLEEIRRLTNVQNFLD